MAGKSSKWEQRKKIFVVALFGVLAFVIVYELFLSGPAPKPRPKTPASTEQVAQTAPAPSAPAKPARRLSAADQQAAEMQVLLSDRTPLKLSLISTSAGDAKVGERGNIFAYWLEPVKPPPPPPPPPPITLVTIQPQSAMAGSPKPL